MNIIKGSGGGKGSGGSGRVANEAVDNLQSKQIARVVDLISEGEIKGLVNGLQSVYLDNTPIQNDDGGFNVNGVGFSTRNGTQSQSHIAGFPGVESEEAVSVEVTQATSLTRTVTDTDADSVRVTLSVPRLTSQNTSNGDVSGTSVRIAIDVQESGGTFVAQKLLRDNINLSVNGSGVASTVDRNILNAQLSVKWEGSASKRTSFQTLGFRVDYRAVGASTWNALSSGSFSGSGRSVADPVDDGSGGGA